MINAFSRLPPQAQLVVVLIVLVVGGIAAVVYLVAALALGKSLRALVRPAALGVILMLVLTLASQRIVIPRMDVLRTQMVSVDATPASDPRRAEFDRLHGISVDLEGGVLMLGLAALFLTVKQDGAHA